MRKRLAVIIAALALLSGVGAGVAVAGLGTWTNDEVNATSPEMRYYINSLTTTTSSSTPSASGDCYPGGLAVHMSLLADGVLVTDGDVYTTHPTYYQMQIAWPRGTTTQIQLTAVTVCMKYD